MLQIKLIWFEALIATTNHNSWLTYTCFCWTICDLIHFISLFNLVQIKKSTKENRLIKNIFLDFLCCRSIIDHEVRLLVFHLIHQANNTTYIYIIQKNTTYFKFVSNLDRIIDTIDDYYHNTILLVMKFESPLQMLIFNT